MSTLRDRARRYVQETARAFERAPAEVAVVLVVGVTLSYAIESAVPLLDAWVEVAVTALLILTAAWTGTMLHALGVWTASRRWLMTVGGAVVFGLYGHFILEFDRAAEGWRAAMLVAAALLWIAALPVVAGPRQLAVERLRGITGRVLLRVLGALLYSAALYAGLALAIASVDTLFELNLEGTLYGHVAGWIFVVLAPLLVIGGIESYARPLTPAGEVAGAVHRMTAFLVPPLLGLYLLILYAYAVRIGITGEVPKNMVSPMVFAAGILVAVALLLFEPRDSGTAAFRPLRLTPVLFLPLSALGVWAITLRVDQYGWTEFRLLRLVLLVTLALLAAGATVQLLQRRRFSLHAAPLALAAVLVLSAVGPWSVLSLSRHSQQTRLERGLRAAGIDPAAATAAPAEQIVAADVYDDVNSSAQYLARHFGPDALPPALAPHARDEAGVYALAERVGLRRGTPIEPEDRFFFGRLDPSAPLEVDDHLVQRVVYGRNVELSPGMLQATQDSLRLSIQGGGRSLTADLDAMLHAAYAVPAAARKREMSPASARLDVLDASGAVVGSLLVLDFNAQAESGRFVLNSLDALLLLHR